MDYKQEFQQEDLVLHAPSMIQIYQKAKMLANKHASVLIYGETGVGKNHLAKYIQQSGTLAQAPFVPIHCNAIPSELFASELFGYSPNAFTGAAAKGKTGLLEAANHGTVLFDEIDELSSENQTLLLHFLQNKTITPLGSLKSRTINARVICISGRDLRKMVNEGSFRLDLYYRICVANICIPPLRERREEIPDFINYYIRKYAAEYNCNHENLVIPTDKMEALSQLDWLGNIREIINFAQQICLTEDIAQTIDTYTQRQNSLSQKNMELINESSHPPLTIKTLKDAVQDFERGYITAIISESENLHIAAKRLGISFSTLCRKKSELGIKQKCQH